MPPIIIVHVERDKLYCWNSYLLDIIGGKWSVIRAQNYTDKAAPHRSLVVRTRLLGMSQHDYSYYLYGTYKTLQSFQSRYNEAYAIRYLTNDGCLASTA